MSHSEKPDLIRYADAAGGSAPGGEPLPNDGARLGPGLLARLLSPDNAWRSIAGKSLSIGAAMVGLAAIGMFSAQANDTRSSKELRPVVDPPVEANHGLSSSWLAGAGLPPDTGSSPDSSATAGASSGFGSPEALQDPPSGESNVPRPGMTADGKVILNSADASDFDRLPGVGKKRAEQIVQLRTKLGGRFKKPSDLLRIRGIGVKSLQKMLPHLVLDPPSPQAPIPEEPR